MTAPEKHTPGPWCVEVVGVRDLDNPTDVCEITNGYTLIAEYVDAHDAALIAAAPDLLAALKAIADPTFLTRGQFAHDAIDRFRTIARAAIAKAEGK